VKILYQRSGAILQLKAKVVKLILIRKIIYPRNTIATYHYLTITLTTHHVQKTSIEYLEDSQRIFYVLSILDVLSMTSGHLLDMCVIRAIVIICIPYIYLHFYLLSLHIWMLSNNVYIDYLIVNISQRECINRFILILNFVH